jgi:hypothetical protein
MSFVRTAACQKQSSFFQSHSLTLRHACELVLHQCAHSTSFLNQRLLLHLLVECFHPNLLHGPFSFCLNHCLQPNSLCSILCNPCKSFHPHPIHPCLKEHCLWEQIILDVLHEHPLINVLISCQFLLAACHCASSLLFLCVAKLLLQRILFHAVALEQTS